ncbi:uncharacterized protein N7458_009749 [Penicillium daleae]|uniref:Uncharacterized protein n=1 Tax=Penicillium daleae TaxID=63821 RepID=A0AAD6BXL1_9EURO|nr:uncharacterized protein N7458_009749 [Penicillium daleae]KAJ5438751.1 hypothetical protein N7458_009749 [Penicillium daleae]
MSSFGNFQTLLDQQVGTLPKRSSWPIHTDKSKKQRPIPLSSLRFQGAAWAAAGGSMYATLHGVFKIFRNFRGLRYI